MCSINLHMIPLLMKHCRVELGFVPLCQRRSPYISLAGQGWCIPNVLAVLYIDRLATHSILWMVWYAKIFFKYRYGRSVYQLATFSSSNAVNCDSDSIIIYSVKHIENNNHKQCFYCYGYLIIFCVGSRGKTILLLSTLY